jgi:hypothetical protein
MLDLGSDTNAPISKAITPSSIADRANTTKIILFGLNITVKLQKSRF